MSIRNLLTTIIIISLSGCAGFQQWDTGTKVLYTGLVTGQAADIATTNYALDNGGEELNPMFDGKPERMLPLKALFLTGAYYLVDWLEPENRKWFLIPANIITWGVVGHNFKVCKDLK